MSMYTFYWTDECGESHDVYMEAADDADAYSKALDKCRGNEGLWTGISLTTETDDEIQSLNGWF